MPQMREDIRSDAEILGPTSDRVQPMSRPAPEAHLHEHFSPEGFGLVYNRLRRKESEHLETFRVQVRELRKEDRCLGFFNQFCIYSGVVQGF